MYSLYFQHHGRWMLGNGIRKYIQGRNVARCCILNSGENAVGGYVSDVIPQKQEERRWARHHSDDSGENGWRTCLRLRTANSGENAAEHGDLRHERYIYRNECI